MKRQLQCDSHLADILRIVRFIETERRMVMLGAGERRTGELVLNGNRVSV